MPIVFSDSLKRLFWGDNLDDLNWSKHEKYITETILEKGDIEDIKWLLSVKPKPELYAELDSFKLSPKSRNFWKLYFSP
jgi:hypothetical protein